MVDGGGRRHGSDGNDYRCRRHDAFCALDGEFAATAGVHRDDTGSRAPRLACKVFRHFVCGRQRLRGGGDATDRQEGREGQCALRLARLFGGDGSNERKQRVQGEGRVRERPSQGRLGTRPQRERREVGTFLQGVRQEDARGKRELDAHCGRDGAEGLQFLQGDGQHGRGTRHRRRVEVRRRKWNRRRWCCR